MGSSKLTPLRIGYAGYLQYFEPGNRRSLAFFSWAKQWFWTYRVDNLDCSTRSAYYLFRGIKYLKENYKVTADDLQIELWGLIDKGNKNLAETLGIDEFVCIDGYLPRNGSLERLNKCDVLFLPLESEGKGQKSLFVPGKLYEYLKLRKPVLALAGKSDCTEILMKSGLGIFANPYDEEAVAEKLWKLIMARERLNSMYVPDYDYINNFHFPKLTSRLASLFDEVLS